MTLNRLVVIGAGAVGGSIGGLLIEAGHPVVFVARGAHGKKIRQDGLLVRMPDRAVQLQPPCVEQIDQIDWQPGDLAMLATKLQDAEAAMDQLVASGGSQIPIVCATNGVHAERWSNARFDTVLSMVVWLPATHLEPGEVRLHSGRVRGVLDTGPLPGDSAVVRGRSPDHTNDASPRNQPSMETFGQSSGQVGRSAHNRCATSLSIGLCTWLSAAGFDAQVRDDIQRWKYAKWITNLGSAAQAMVTDDWQAVAAVARSEGEAVLAKSGVPRVTTQELLDRTSHVEALPIDGHQREGGSTWQSHHRGKPMESRWIEGAMADLADEFGIRAPVNRFLSDTARAPRPLLASEVLTARR